MSSHTKTTDWINTVLQEFLRLGHMGWQVDFIPDEFAPFLSKVLDPGLEVDIESNNDRFDLWLRLFRNPSDHEPLSEYLIAKGVATPRLAVRTMLAFMKEFNNKPDLYTLFPSDEKPEPVELWLRTGRGIDDLRTSCFEITEGQSYLVSIGIPDGVSDLVGMEVTPERVTFGSWEPTGEWRVDSIFDLRPHLAHSQIVQRHDTSKDDDFPL